MKKCVGCKITKLNSEFNKNKSEKDGLSDYCKQCRKEYYFTHRCKFRKLSNDYRLKHKKERQIYNDSHKKEARERRLKIRYGITLKQYNQMLKEQKGFCAICGNKESRLSNNKKITILSVDHNHETGQVRKLLCYRCNHVLGLVNDNIILLENHIKYLKN